MQTFKLETNTDILCPGCSKNLNGATGDCNAIPTDGDLTVCMYCYLPLVYVGKGMDIKLRIFTLEEIKELRDQDYHTWRQLMHNIEVVRSLKSS